MAERIDQADGLLHEAQHRHGGAKFARFAGDTAGAERMVDEAAAMIREAYALDADFCDQCRADDAEDGGMYADFWAFASASRAAGTGGRDDA